MSSNGINVCEDIEMADCDGEKVVTMMDVLKEQEDFEEDANAVLGASDDKNCTYSKGYIKRQAIYACMTCCVDAKYDPSKWAGVCLACSLACHESHELIELYTKRNFRCDCGNPKFNSHPCQFTPMKTDLNVENSYNQNFSGVYCICHRPYPDPESSTEEEMIQCIICEDWLHSNHLDADVPPNEQYSEMICKACMNKNEFLHDYHGLAANKNVDILNTSLEANCNDNLNPATPENVTKPNSDDVINEQLENDPVLESTDDKDETKNLEKKCTNLEFTESQESSIEKQSTVETSANNVTGNELENDDKTDTKQDNDTEETNMEMEKVQEANDNEENQISLIETKTSQVSDKEILDIRSQEQVEEDLLLADPMETDSSEKEDAINISSSNDIQSNVDSLINEKKLEPEAMEKSKSISEDLKEKMEDKADDIPIIEQSENQSSVVESKNTTTTDTSEIVATSTNLESIANAVKIQDDVSTEQINTVPTNELQSISTNEQSDHVATVEQAAEHINYDNEETNVSVIDATTKISDEIGSSRKNDVYIKDESKMDDAIHNDTQNNGSELNSIISDKNGSLRKDDDDDIKKANKIDDAVNNDTQNIDRELNSVSDIEIPDKAIDTDILKRKHSSDSDTENMEVKKAKLEETQCARPKGVKKVHLGATFWPSNFRQKLCTCNECISMYKDLSVLFLVDPEDTVTAYERLGKEKTNGKPASQYEKGMEALSSLDRVQQINAMTEYSKLRDKLLDFLKTFKDKKVIVKEEDIKAFFAGMKPVREPDGVYFCR